MSIPLCVIPGGVFAWTVFLMLFLTVVLLKTNATATSTDVASETQRPEIFVFSRMDTPLA